MSSSSVIWLHEPGVLVRRAHRVAPVWQCWQPCTRQQRQVSDAQPTAPPCIGGPGVAAQCINRPPLPRRIHRPSIPMRTSSEIREAFLNFFSAEHQHSRVDAVPLIPVSRDEGSYFINSGMMQFKPIFLGQTRPESFTKRLRRATNSQRCARLGGKHNDLDDVGRDGTHFTLFEMLGSWSFGDYGREEACAMAWEFLTKVLGLPSANLYVTYFGGDKELGLKADTYTRDVWLNLGVSDARLMPFGKKDNFWEMADHGPCGPCTEIHFDLIGDRCARCFVNEDSPEVVEVWNLVFMEYQRVQESGLIRPLVQRHVDTGLGLERMSSIIQGVTSAYDTDLFTGLLSGLQERSGQIPPYGGQFGDDEAARRDTAYRIVADHLRLAGVAVADGLLPAKRGLGLKLRTVLQRAIRQAREHLKMQPGGVADMSRILVDALANVRPGIGDFEEQIRQVLLVEEETFYPRLVSLNAAFERLMVSRGTTRDLSHAEVQDLMRQQRCSFDLVRLLALDRGIDADPLLDRSEGHDESEEALLYRKPKQVAALLKDMKIPPTAREDVYDYSKNRKGRYEFPVQDARVLAVIGPEGVLEGGAADGGRCGLILDNTAFYSTAGGQECDTGLLTVNLSRHQPHVLFHVEKVTAAGPYVIHEGQIAEGEDIRPGQPVRLQINSDRRLGLMQHHTGTHIFNFCLRDLFGNGRVKQTQSEVQSDRMMFGFATVAHCSLERLEAAEEHARQMIRAGLPVFRQTMDKETASMNPHIHRLDGYAYPSSVHVISLGDTFAGLRRLAEKHPAHVAVDRSPLACAEMCGGTHVHNTADLVDFVVLSLRGTRTYYKEAEVMLGHSALEVRARGEELRLEATDLADCVISCRDKERWSERLQTIDRTMGQELLPKTARDRINEILAPLRRQIVGKEREEGRKMEEELLMQSLTAAIEEEGVAVATVSFSNISRIVKFVHRLSPSQPVIIVDDNVDTTAERRFVLYVPQAMDVTAKLLADRLGSAVNSDVDLSRPILQVGAGKGKLGDRYAVCFGGNEKLYKDERLRELLVQCVSDLK